MVLKYREYSLFPETTPFFKSSPVLAAELPHFLRENPGLLRPAPGLLGLATGAAAGYAGTVAWMPGETGGCTLLELVSDGYGVWQWVKLPMK